MKRCKKLILALVLFAAIALLAYFLLPGVATLSVGASINAGSQINPFTSLDLVYTRHSNPLNVQQAPPLTNVTDGSDSDEIMSSISSPVGYDDCLMAPLLSRNEAQSPEPGPDDQTEYMIGDVAVTVIFP